MMNQSASKPILFDSPVNYQIRVLGRINPNWSDQLQGMEIDQTAVEEGHLESTLHGELSSLDALADVLNMLYEQHLTILLVERMGN
jgi:hypothetical protein